jgi:hypothetical protein
VQKIWIVRIGAPFSKDEQNNVSVSGANFGFSPQIRQVLQNLNQGRRESYFNLQIRRQKPAREIQGITMFVHNAFNPVGIASILRLQSSNGSAVDGIWRSLHNVNHMSLRLSPTEQSHCQ